VLLGGGDPYSAAELLVVERQIGWQRAEALLMYNPPWTLAIILPFCFLPYTAARSLWFLLLALGLLYAGDWVWRNYGGLASQRWVSSIAVLLFAPAYQALILGQISPLVLIGLVGFVSAIERKRYLPAGFFGLLIATKPHLVFLFWLVLILWIFRIRYWKLLISIGIFLAGPVLLVSVWRPSLLFDFFELVSSGRQLLWVTPTLGMLLRAITGFRATWPQFVPCILGTAACLILWNCSWKANFSWRRYLVPILLLSTMTTLFAWAFDMVVLSPCVLILLIWFLKSPARNCWILIVLVLTDVLYIQVLWATKNEYFTLWVPWVFALLALVKWRFSHDRSLRLRVG
jgi:hypothetical protein